MSSLSAFVPMAMLFVALLAREYSMHLERQDWAKKETDLLQRIQAPAETVMAKHLDELPDGASPVPAFDDDDVNKILARIG